MTDVDREGNQRMELNSPFYATIREVVKKKLGLNAEVYIDALDVTV